MRKNQLYYGDNLDVLRDYIKDESVDLIYLDPPFNSAQDYNVLFAEKDGTRILVADHRLRGHLGVEHRRRARLPVRWSSGGGRVAEAMRAFRTFLGDSDMMAYLAMMAPRLVELRRVLKPTGSHLPALRPHRKPLFEDADGWVFGPTVFRNEVVWT